MISVTASVGLLSFLNVKSTLIIIEVIPFLVLAVGVDNIFIMTQAFQRENLKDDEDFEMKVGQVLGHVGPSLLLAVVAECSCFFLGALTSMPAVRIFAVNAGLALLIDFILQLVVFLPILILDLRRQIANRYEVFCCFQGEKYEELETSVSESQEVKEGLLHKFFKHAYTPFITKDSTRFFIVSLSNIFFNIILLFYYRL